METKELLNTLSTEIKEFKSRIDADLEAANGTLRVHSEEIRDIIGKSSSAAYMHSASGLAAQSSVNKDLDQFIRTAGENKALSISGGATAGANAVIPFTSSTLETLLREGNPFRELITIQMVQENSGFEELVSSGSAGSTFVSETAARTELANPVLNKITTDLMEIYSLQTLTQRLLSQSFVDMSQWISDEMAVSISETEATAFVSGTGTGEPLGLENLTYDLLTDKTRPFGNVQKIVSGDAASLLGIDVLKECLYSLKAGYRSNSTWVMNSLTALQVSKFKDSAGNYLWSESLIVGEPSSLLGRPVMIVESVADIGAGALPIFLADWDQAYRFITGNTFQLSPDPYSNKPNIDFYSFFYTGFSLRKSEALKAISIEV